MRVLVFFVLFTIVCYHQASAQADTSTTTARSNFRHAGIQDSTLKKTDSIGNAIIRRQQFIEDSVAMQYLIPDPNRENLFLSNILKNDLSDISYFSANRAKPKNVLKTGQIRNSRPLWLIETIACLLVYAVLLNLFFNREIKNVLQSFYNKHILSQVEKEGAGINFRTFIGLFVLFSLSFGLVLYQLTVYRNVYFDISGLTLFIYISIGTCLLFSIKFLILKFIGVVFDINRLVSQYIAIINLTYFNIAFLLLFVGICFSLLSANFVPYLLTGTLTLIAVIFVWQYLRNSLNVIANFRFHKFYLFIYLCALEICPILILIKALNI